MDIDVNEDYNIFVYFKKDCWKNLKKNQLKNAIALCSLSYFHKLKSTFYESIVHVGEIFLTLT